MHAPLKMTIKNQPELKVTMPTDSYRINFKQTITRILL